MDARSPSPPIAPRVLQAGGGGAKPGKAEAPKEGGTQVWLLPFADGGEARQLTDLPMDVGGLEWSPDGRRLVVVSRADSTEPERKPERKPDDPPEPDTRLIDTLSYQFNGAGFVYERFTRLWIVDATTGEAELLTSGQSPRPRSAVVARRPPDRLHIGPPPQSRPRLAQRHLPRRRSHEAGSAALTRARTPAMGRGELVAGRPMGGRHRHARLEAR